MNYPASALVLGLGSHGLSIIRSLGRRGVYVEAVDCNAKPYYKKSKFLKSYYQVRSLFNEQLVDFLLNYSKNKSHPIVLYIVRDQTVPLIEHYRQELTDAGYIFNLPSKEIINILMDKAYLPIWLLKQRIYHPNTQICRSYKDIEKILNNVKLPCIVKPQKRHQLFKAQLISDSKQLFNLLSDYIKKRVIAVVQEWIEGPTSSISFCFCYIGIDGKVKAAVTGRKKRQLPPDTGSATELMLTEERKIKNTTLSIFKQLNYKGFGSIEFKQSIHDGRNYLIEFTVGRTDLNHAVTKGVGIDLPWIAFCDVLGLPNNTINHIEAIDLVSRPKRWIDGRRNRKALTLELQGKRLGILSAFFCILSTLDPRNEFALFCWDDFLPWCYYLISQVYLIIKKGYKFIKNYYWQN